MGVCVYIRTRWRTAPRRASRGVITRGPNNSRNELARPRGALGEVLRAECAYVYIYTVPGERGARSKVGGRV